jgi:hypothetical protein
MAATLAAPSGPSFENKTSAGSKLRIKSAAKIPARQKIRIGIPPKEGLNGDGGLDFFMVRIISVQAQSFC